MSRTLGVWTAVAGVDQFDHLFQRDHSALVSRSLPAVTVSGRLDSATVPGDKTLCSPEQTSELVSCVSLLLGPSVSPFEYITSLQSVLLPRRQKNDTF
jgi:hypothetical protein